MPLENFLYVVVGLILGVSIMLIPIGSMTKDKTILWAGILGLLLGGYLFIIV